MKRSVALFLILLTSFDSLAVMIPVNVRDQKQNLQIQQIEFSDYAENEHFKIIRGTEDQTLDFASDSLSYDEKLRAGTVLHHLSVARDYFINVLGSQYVASLPKLTARIDMDKRFNEFFLFVKDSKVSEVNNAVTIAGSNTRAMPEVPKWNMEIWFRPARDEEVDNSVYQFSKAVDGLDLTSSMIGTIADTEIKNTVMNSAILNTFSGIDYVGLVNSLFYFVGIFEVAPKILMTVSGPFKSKTYLDTAMIPEVIYHEFAHVALSDEISVRKSTPLNEGMANYFGAVINNHAKIAGKTGKYSKNLTAYNGKDDGKYDSKMESESAAHANFVFSFLWRVRTRLDKEIPDGKLLADKLIFNSRKYITYAKKPIKDDLLPALIRSADDVAQGQQARKLRFLLTNVATEKGL